MEYNCSIRRHYESFTLNLFCRHLSFYNRKATYIVLWFFAWTRALIDVGGDHTILLPAERKQLFTTRGIGSKH